jgi:DNA repair exonuclease SbcCD ATPase subunit
MSDGVGFQDAQELVTLVGEKFQTLLRAEEALSERRDELGQLLAELQSIGLSTSVDGNTETEALRREVGELRQLLSERERKLAEMTESSGAKDDLDRKMSDVEAENGRLGKLLEEKEKRIITLRDEIEQILEASPEVQEARAYEAEINDFRRQLESDRQLLNEEISQLRSRNAELNDAVRQAELELSRERAQLARERAQLDRLREEVRQELARAQREAGVRERLAGVQKLKEELAERKQDSRDSASAQNTSGSWWGNVLRRASDL